MPLFFSLFPNKNLTIFVILICILYIKIFDHDQKVKDIQRCMYTKIYLTPNIIRKALYYSVYWFFKIIVIWNLCGACNLTLYYLNILSLIHLNLNIKFVIACKLWKTRFPLSSLSRWQYKIYTSVCLLYKDCIQLKKS